MKLPYFCPFPLEDDMPLEEFVKGCEQFRIGICTNEFEQTRACRVCAALGLQGRDLFHRLMRLSVDYDYVYWDMKFLWYMDDPDGYRYKVQHLFAAACKHNPELRRFKRF